MIRNRARLMGILAGWLVLAGQLPAQAPLVKDDAGMFSATTVGQASEAIKKITLAFKRDVRVETFKAPAAKFNDLTPAQKQKYFDDWAESRAKALAVQGIYIHICKEPGHLEVVVDEATRKKAFTAADRDAVRDLLMENFKKKEYDNGLDKAVALVRARLEKNLGPVTSIVAKGITDDGRFFSPATLTKAAADIKAFRERFEKDVLVETFEAPPDNIRKQLDAADAAGSNRIMGEWVRQRSAAAGIDGIHVLICKEPPKIQVDIADNTRKKAFTNADRDELLRKLIEGFKAKKFDQTLAASLDDIYDAVDKNLTAAVPAPVAGAVRDDAGLFGAAARAAAVEAIKAVKNDHACDVTIETFARVPPGKVKLVEAMTTADRAKFFASWIEERAGTAGVKGIYVLICRQPSNIQIGLGEDVRQKAFRTTDRTELGKLITAQIQAKQADSALAGAIRLIWDTLDRNSADPMPAPVAGSIKDYAGYFGPPAREQAAEKIKDLMARHQFELTVETFARVPPGKLKQVAAMSDADRAQFFKDWTKERADQTGTQGAWVLICKQPASITVAGGGDPAKKSRLQAVDRDRLRELLAARFKENAADKGLLEALTYIADTLPALPIKDAGGFFSAAAVDKGDAAIRDIRRRVHYEVLVETFAEASSDQAKGVDLSDRDERRKVFTAWAADRQKAASVDGIIILICKNPKAFQVAVGPETGKRFSAAERDQVAKLLLTRFNDKNFDGGLAEALAFIADPSPNTRPREVPVDGQPAPIDGFADLSQVRETTPAVVPTAPVEPSKDKSNASIAKNKDGTAPDAGKAEKSGAATVLDAEAGGFKMIWLVWGILILLALWIFIGVLRALFGLGRRSSPPPQQPAAPYGGGGAPPAHPYASGAPIGTPPTRGPAPGYAPAAQASGGAGFFSGLMGGMFGAAAGSVLYDRFARGLGGTGWAGPASSSPPPASTSGLPVGETRGGHDSGAVPTAPTGYSSAGGDFGEEKPTAAPTGYSSAGGDFGEEKPTVAPTGYSSAGGDFGEEKPTASPSGYYSTGGDFGEPPAVEPEIYTGAGNSTATDQSGSGGDFGNQADEAASTGAGGDFGTESIEPVAGSGGGDYGVDADASGASGGGDFGGGGSDSGGGGARDVEAGGDTGGGDASSSGGDFS